MNKKKVLILGVSGMLGHILLNKMSLRDNMEIRGTVRDIKSLTDAFYRRHKAIIYDNISTYNIEVLKDVVEDYKPDIIINAIGIIKQIKDKESMLSYLYVNSLFPRLLCQVFGDQYKIIQISTDCIFDGKKGAYTEADLPSPTDIYSMSKVLGEVYDHENVLTIRTSIIGHELKTKNGLLEWFLSNNNKEVCGYTNAIYSGFTVIELERIISEYIIGKDFYGLYQLSSLFISKYDLLQMVKDIYSVSIDIRKDSSLSIDRSLDSSTEKKIIGYNAPTWYTMISDMRKDFLLFKNLYEEKVY